jgi:hypothetical protein
MRPHITSTLAFAFLALAATAAGAQTYPSSNATTQPPGTQAAQPQAVPSRGPIPSKSETAMEAYGKLNRGNAGYLTWDDVKQLEGFETAFQQADQNHDGRLNPAEFNSAWAMYTGNNP